MIVKIIKGRCITDLQKIVFSPTLKSLLQFQRIKTLGSSSYSCISLLHSLIYIKMYPFTLHPKSDPKYEDS